VLCWQYVLFSSKMIRSTYIFACGKRLVFHFLMVELKRKSFNVGRERWGGLGWAGGINLIYGIFFLLLHLLFKRNSIIIICCTHTSIISSHHSAFLFFFFFFVLTFSSFTSESSHARHFFNFLFNIFNSFISKP